MHRIGAYAEMAAIWVILLGIIFLPILLILKKKGKQPLRCWAYFGFFCSIFLIVFATILYMPITFKPQIHILNLVPFIWMKVGNSWYQFIAEELPNVLMFIPFGIFLPIAWKKTRKWYIAALAIFILTFCIEFFQYFIGRAADINDIITNLLGGLIGYAVFALCRKVWSGKARWQRLLGTYANN